jgi:phospholipase/lecithinase/hemolysin
MLILVCEPLTPSQPSNITAISEKMKEYTTTVNTIWSYQVPFELLVSRRYPCAEIVYFDVHSLLTDIYYNPSAYLAAPANATGFVDQCNADGSVCNKIGSIDAFMWYDELHPSQGTDRVIAREFINVVEGNSSYATYWRAVGGEY